MNDSELKQKLAAWRLPPTCQEAQSRAEWHALAAFKNLSHMPGRRTTPERISRRSWLLPAGIGAAVALLLAAWLRFQPAADPSLQNPESLLAELESFFQGRLAAVVRKDGAVDLRLIHEPIDRAPDQRVAVRLQWPEETIEILTYSGVPVCVDSPGGTLCLTPLITGSGSVLLLSDTGLLENRADLRTETQILQGT